MTNLLTAVLLTGLLILISSKTALALDQPFPNTGTGNIIDVTSKKFQDFGPDAAGGAQLEQLFSRIISISVAGAFIALVVVLVWAGIKFLTSGGDSKALDQARSTITWGLLGILFLAIAWLILQLIAAFTGIEALKFFDITVLQK